MCLIGNEGNDGEEVQGDAMFLSHKNISIYMNLRGVSFATIQAFRRTVRIKSQTEVYYQEAVFHCLFNCSSTMALSEIAVIFYAARLYFADFAK